MQVVGDLLWWSCFILLEIQVLISMVHNYRLEKRCKRLEKGEETLTHCYLRLHCLKNAAVDPYRAYPCDTCPTDDNPGLCESCPALRKFLDEGQKAIHAVRQGDRHE
jgi:hypothetical protein